MVFAADDHASQGPLGGIVVQWDTRLLEESGQPRPQIEHVGDGSAHLRFRQHRPAVLERPLQEIVDDRLGLLPPQSAAQLEDGIAIVVACPGSCLADPSLDRKELLELPDRRGQCLTYVGTEGGLWIVWRNWSLSSGSRTAAKT